MSESQTTLLDFVSPSTEDSVVEIETLSQIIDRQIDESYEQAEVRGDFDDVSPSGETELNYGQTLSGIAEELRVEEYNIAELETALKTVLIEGVSGNMIYKHSFSPYFVSGNVKNWSQNAGGLKAFKEQARRLRDTDKVGGDTVQSIKAEVKEIRDINNANADDNKSASWFLRNAERIRAYINRNR